MFKNKIQFFVVLGFCLLFTLTSAKAVESPSKRVPAEWEPQEAIWLQWPGRWEKTYEPAFAKFSRIIADYQKLHILFHSKKVEQQARDAITAAGGNADHENIIWHRIANDIAWMSDNGPVYIEEAGEMKLQNWEFDAWGGAFGPDVGYHLDNRVPDAVAAYLGLP
ncbi:MAG: agmatine deiminase family protein, partial [Pseudomonadota bacterium]